jgi:sec-independent protein translocase protein TatC
MSKLTDKLLGSIKSKGKSLEGEMSFFEHLEALRWHLIRSALAIVVFAIFAFTYYTEIFDGIVMAPTKKTFLTYRVMCSVGEWLHGLISAVNPDHFCMKQDIKVNLLNTEVAGQFTLQINSAIVIGITLGVPYILWELWKFVKPALHNKEKRSANGFVFFSSMLFALGVSFGYFVVTPLAVKFLVGYTVSESIVNMFSIDSYVSIVTMLTLASGLAFQLPIVVYILARIGILTPQFMRRTRRYAIVIILILAAFITPTPDALTMCIVALPLLLLYEVSIFVAAAVQRNKIKDGDIIEV